MRKAILICCLMLAACSVPVSAQDTQKDAQQEEPKRGPSTAEERARFVALTHKLEATPLDKNLYPDKKWAMDWITDIPDITVTPCPFILGEDFVASRYRYAGDIMYQVVFGNVVFLIEHPDKKNDKVAQYAAGVESALKAYKGILRADPMHVSREMEELLQKQSEGKLLDFVRESSKQCSSGDQTGL